MEEEEDDAPPMLVTADDTIDPTEATLSAEMQDVKITKVPITIITGRSNFQRTSVLRWYHMHIFGSTFCTDVNSHTNRFRVIHTQHRSVFNVDNSPLASYHLLKYENTHLAKRDVG